MLLGGLRSSDWRQFGGSQYAKVIQNSLWGVPPALDMDYEKRVQKTVRSLVRERAVASAHDLGEGGLAVALAESSFGPARIGADIELDSDLQPELALFHEGPSRILVTTDNPERVMREAKGNGIEALTIGITISGMLRMSQRDVVLIESSLEELREPWAEYLGSVFQAAVVA
jgi:phosphoribosylformylglycinamidine synthase